MGGLVKKFYLFGWLLAAVVVILTVYHAPFMALHSKWVALSDSYSHGYLIILIALYWVLDYLHRHEVEPTLGFSALPLSILVTLFWYFGYSTQMLIVEQLALPLILICFFQSVFGWRKTLKLAVPFAFMFLAIPVWDVLLPLLRVATVKVVQLLTAIFGIPAFIDGFEIELPYGILQVAGSCAGLNYFMMGFAIGIFHARQETESRWKKLALVGLALLFAIVANWIRVFSLVLIGYYSEMESSIVYDHGTFGWVIFGIALLAYFAVSRWILKTEPAEDDLEAENLPDSAQIADSSRGSWVYLIVPGILLLVFSLPASLNGNYKEVSPVAMVDLPAEITSMWVSQAAPTMGINFDGWDQSFVWHLKASHGVELAVYLYHSQTQGKEMIYYANRIASEDAVIESFTYKGGGDSIPFNVAIVAGEYRNHLVLSTYQIGRQFTASDLEGKLLQFSESLAGNDVAAIYVVSLPCDAKDCKKIRENLWASELHGNISRTIKILANVFE